ncbi:hypothetical protein [Enterobacter sp. A103]|uniref:hypothetical protein n=1 Tax=Enterobacter sp. A103 TaxID=3102785 RepID=UPI002AC9FAC4|nr:hypothetical protein [Enterobacter sp. A103]MDZ5641676.1 hypothetical protein [Enterobacter sp. A103]
MELITLLFLITLFSSCAEAQTISNSANGVDASTTYMTIGGDYSTWNSFICSSDLPNITFNSGFTSLSSSKDSDIADISGGECDGSTVYTVRGDYFQLRGTAIFNPNGRKGNIKFTFKKPDGSPGSILNSVIDAGKPNNISSQCSADVPRSVNLGTSTAGGSAKSVELVTNPKGTGTITYTPGLRDATQNPILSSGTDSLSYHITGTGITNIDGMISGPINISSIKIDSISTSQKAGLYSGSLIVSITCQ